MNTKYHQRPFKDIYIRKAGVRRNKIYYLQLGDQEHCSLGKLETDTYYFI